MIQSTNDSGEGKQKRALVPELACAACARDDEHVYSQVSQQPRQPEIENAFSLTLVSPFGLDRSKHGSRDWISSCQGQLLQLEASDFPTSDP